MANITNYLTNTPGSPKGSLGDFRHASGAFVENNYRLSPRYKFLFHAYFEVDNTVPGFSQFSGASSDVSLLVKTATLPSMKYESVTKNQYNRKKIVHKQMTYDPIQFTFHDDSAGLMTALWSAYNSYFNVDSQNSSASAWVLGNKFTGNNYGMNVKTPQRPFKRISLYTFSDHKYQGYTLWGPRINSWTPGDVAYSAGNEVVESTMTIEYEGVSYSSGSVSEGSPDGFAGHPQYDHIPSPLNTNTGAGANIIFDSVPAPSTALAGSFISNSLSAQRENFNISLPTAPLIAGAIQLLPAINLIGGAVGTAFPGINDNSITVIAKAKTVNDPITTNTFSGSTGLAPTIA